MTEMPNHRRRPWVALALSLLAMGVGHIYCGRVGKGLVLYVPWFVAPILVLVAAVLPVSSATLVMCILLPTLLLFAIHIYAALDAYLSARRSDPGYKLQDYNRAGIYALLILVQLTGPVGLTVGVREFVFEAFYIPAQSMSPTVLRGDRVLANKLAIRKRFPERGDLVVFRNPEPEGGTVFIKRVVALAGDTVVMDGEHVEINGKRLERVRIPSEALRDDQLQPAATGYHEFNAGRRYMVGYVESGEAGPNRDRFEMTVPDRSVFVLGDNRDRSRDSRHFGAIHMGDLIGYVQYNYYPAQNWSRFGAFRN